MTRRRLGSNISCHLSLTATTFVAIMVTMVEQRHAQGGPAGIAAETALAGIRVIDAADELAAYASRLLADLGADVIRVEPPGGSRTRHADPMVSGSSAFDQFVNAGKRSVTLDIATADGRALFQRLLASADILIETWSGSEAARLRLTTDDVAGSNPRLVHVSVTAFGRDRPRDDVDDDDLTVMAAGGLLNLGGYPDSAPLAAYGGQSRNAASLFAAVAALVVLLERETTGRGRWVDVSAQECVAQALEDTVVAYELTGQVRKRHGSEAAEAGTGIYPCVDGLVSMVAGRVGTAKAWQALTAWLLESGAAGAEALQDGAWSELAYRQTPEAIAAFSAVFADFARTRTRLELYRDAQRRGIALSPVNDIAGVLADPQLQARGFWVSVADPATGADVVFPGPPYRLSHTPALPARPAPTLGADSVAVLGADLGLGAAEIEALQEAGIS
jgi:benzylsuccinate CoA-transferase BbsE subunit